MTWPLGPRGPGTWLSAGRKSPERGGFAAGTPIAQMTGTRFVIIRKLLITLSITASCLALSPSAFANTKTKPEPAQREKVGKPAGEAKVKAKRAVVTPSRAAKDRSWSSDTTRRERVPMKKSGKVVASL